MRQPARRGPQLAESTLPPPPARLAARILRRVVVRGRQGDGLLGGSLGLRRSGLGFCPALARGLRRGSGLVGRFGRRCIGRRGLFARDVRIRRSVLRPAPLRLGLGLLGARGFGDRRLLVDRPFDHRRTFGFDCSFTLLLFGAGVGGLAATAPAPALAAFGRLLRLFGPLLRLRFGRLGGLVRRMARFGFPALATAASTATPATTPTAAPVALAFARALALFAPRLGLFLLLVLERDFDGLVFVPFLHSRRFDPGSGHRTRTGALDGHPGAFEALVDQDLDRHAVAMLDIGELGALLVEHIDARFLARAQQDALAAPARCLVFEDSKRGQAGGGGGAHQARAVAVRAGLGRRLQHAGPEPLPAHLHQTEAGDSADLDPGAVVLERVLHRLFDLPDMAVLLHVDEVDYDQSGHVAQPKLTRDLLRRLEIGVGGGLLDIVLAGRTAGVDVDRNQRLGRVDHQVTARFQLDDRLIHRGELVLDTVALEQRRSFAVELHSADVARHQQFHEAAGLLVALLALDDHFLDLAMIEVADGALDEVAVAVDQRRGGTSQGALPDLV